MAGFLEYLQIVINADAKGAVNGFGQASGAAQASQKSFMGFKASTALVVAGAALVGAELYRSVKAYEEQNLAVLKLQNSLKNNPVISNASTKAFEDQANAIQRVTAAADEDIISAQAMLGTFRMTRNEIMGLTPLVVDYARKFDTDLVTAAKQVGKAFDGSVGALKRNGVTIDENLFKTDRYRAIMQALRSQVGGFAEAEGKTFSGTMERLKNAIGDIEEVIGGALAPTLTQIASTFADAAGGANDFISSLGGGSGGLGDVLGFVNDAWNPLTLGLHQFNAVMALARGETRNAGVEFVRSIPFIGALAGETGGLTKGLNEEAAAQVRAILGIEKTTEGHKRQADETRRTSTEIWALIDAELALTGAQLAFERSLQSYNTTMGDSTKTDLEKREAQSQLETSIRQVAKAAGDQAAADLGANANAKQQDIARIQAQTSALLNMAAQTSGPVRSSILGHIAQLNAIPPSKMTSVEALIAAGQLAAAEAQLRYLTRDRESRVYIRGIPDDTIGRQFGGPVAKNTPYIVGEAGPELFVPHGAGQIIPNHQLHRTGGGGGGGGTVVVNVHNRGSVMSERELVDVVAEGLRAAKRRGGNLGLN